MSRTAAAFADMVALLVKAPRSITQLTELTGIRRNTIYLWTKLLQGEDLIVRSTVPPTNGPHPGRSQVWWTWKP